MKDDNKDDGQQVSTRIFDSHKWSHDPRKLSLPSIVEFEVISSCNLNCGYCYAKPFNGMITPLEDLSLLFKKTKKEVNPPDVIIVGGEPFLRNDIIDLMNIAGETFVHFGISTNGTMFYKLSKDQITELRKIQERCGDKTIQVSLDSINPYVNDLLRGGTDAVVKGLDTLEENNIKFMVGIVLTNNNIHTVPDTLKFLLKKYRNLCAIHLQDIKPSETIGLEYFKLRLNSDEFFSINKIAEDLKENFDRNDVNIYIFTESRNTGRDYAHLLKEKQPGDKCLVDDCGFTYHSLCYHHNEEGFPQCVAGLVRAGVFATGDVTPCLFLRNISIGNLYKESWNEIWDRSLRRYFNLPSLGMEKGDQCFFHNIKKTELI